MEHFRKIWNEEKRRWLLENGCGKDRRKVYADFLAAFPDASDVTFIGLMNYCSRIGAVSFRNKATGSRKQRPLYSEQEKKGYIRIKIAQPNVWISKSKWVYMETHPWEDFTERSSYVFLDGNTRNFAPENIERVPLKIMGLYSSFGGVVPGHPELSRLHIMQAKLKYAIFDKGEKAGLVKKVGDGRVFTAEYNARAREYASRPEVKERNRKYMREYNRELKFKNPEKYEENKRRHREYLKTYQKEYYRRKRNENKGM